MIVKDEEKVLDKCLSSIKEIVDEIIIVDTGSIDNSINIAKKYTHKIYQIKWENDFSKARNYSFSKATKDYILWLDADDYLNEESINRFKSLKDKLDGSIDVYYFLYDFNENYEPFFRERLLKKDCGFKFKGKVHEVITPNGNIAYENIIVKQQYKENKTVDRNLKIYETMDYKTLNDRDLYYYGKELYRNKKYNKAIKVLIKFLNNESNYIEDKIDACFVLGNIYALNKDYTKALKVYFNSFAYDKPRNNILVEIANTFYKMEKIEIALFYYHLALNNKNINYKSFIEKNYFDYYPCIGLSLCYYKVNDLKKALLYHELAYKNKIKDNLYFNNLKYFKNEIK